MLKMYSSTLTLGMDSFSVHFSNHVCSILNETNQDIMSPQVDKSRQFNSYRNYSHHQGDLKTVQFLNFDPINPHNIPVR